MLLGADLLLSGDRPLPDRLRREARARGLAVVPVIRFNSMVQPRSARATRRPVLADVKAVGSRLSAARRDHARSIRPIRQDVSRSGIPAPGEAWIDTRLAARLDVQVGAQLAVGETTLNVTAIVQQDPEVTGGLFTLGPKLLMNIDDVAATRLLQPGNRATWRLLVAGAASDAYRDWAKR